jgi:hypothetical protein
MRGINVYNAAISLRKSEVFAIKKEKLYKP